MPAPTRDAAIPGCILPVATPIWVMATTTGNAVAE
jgi:hypothetical protein